MALAVVYLIILVLLPVRDAHGGFADSVAQGVIALLSIHGTRESSSDLVVPFAIRLLLVSLAWLWPNWRYWNRREVLFS